MMMVLSGRMLQLEVCFCIFNMIRLNFGSLMFKMFANICVMFALPSKSN